MATFTSKIYESITLNGNDLGSYTTNTIEGINYVDNRIMNCPSGSTTDLFTLSSTPGPGTFIANSLKYARITNRSSTQVEIITTDSIGHISSYMISSGSSFFLSTSKMGDATGIMNNISTVSIQPSGSSATIEYYIATT